MKEQNIQEFLDQLFKKKITKRSLSSGSYETEIIDREGRGVFEETLRKFLLDNRDEKQGILEAKVFMYEQIISKSNFAPMLEKQPLTIPETDTTERG